MTVLKDHPEERPGIPVTQHTNPSAGGPPRAPGRLGHPGIWNSLPFSRTSGTRTRDHGSAILLHYNRHIALAREELNLKTCPLTPPPPPFPFKSRPPLTKNCSCRVPIEAQNSAKHKMISSTK